MGKGACIKKMAAVKSYSTNTIMEKKQTEEGGGRGLKYEIFRGKINLKVFMVNPIQR